LGLNWHYGGIFDLGGGIVALKYRIVAHLPFRATVP